MSSWPSATGRSSSRNRRTGRCSEPVCGSETKPRPAARARSARRRTDGVGYRSSARAWQATPRPRRSWSIIASASIAVVRSAGSPASSTSIATREPVDAARRHAQARRARRRRGRCARSTGFRPPRRPRAGSPPRTARRRRGRGAGLVLREGHDMEVDEVAILLPDRQHRRHPLQAGRGVDVDERLHVQHAVEHGLVEGAPYVGDDPRTVVALLDDGGVPDDGAHRLAHAVRGVRTRAPRRRPSATCRPCRGAGGR